MAGQQAVKDCLQRLLAGSADRRADMKIDGRLITCVVSDFDGTIIRPGTHEPPERFFTVVEMLLKQGIHFVAASGRQYPNLRRILEPVAGRIGFIAENGALVVWNNEVLHKCTVERTLAMELIKDMEKEPDSEILVSGEKTCYIVPHDLAYADMLEHKVKNVVTILEDFRQVDEMLKISILYPQGIPEAAERAFHEKYDDRLLVVESGNGWLDFMPRESGKGAALKLLAHKMGFDLNHTISFGDSENDISMLRTSGLGYAMSFAREHVRAAADGVCESVEDMLWRALKFESELSNIN